MQTQQEQSFDNTCYSNLPDNVLYSIMSFLTTKDVLHCVQVCTTWKALLYEKYFWRIFISKKFDLSLETDIKDEDPFSEWSDPEEWYNYFDDEKDPYVMRPFPSMWKCRVIHPFGLDPLAGDVKSLRGLSRSLEILVKMKNVVKFLDLCSGGQCSASEGENGICVVLFPWDKDELPTTKDILTEIFHFHPEISGELLARPDDGDGKWHDKKLIYHVKENDDGSDSEDDHDIGENPCLNRIFGFASTMYEQKSGVTVEKVEAFYKWLQNIMVPTVTLFAADGKLNPVVVFFLTKLAPGWVGGALTGVIYT